MHRSVDISMVRILVAFWMLVAVVSLRSVAQTVETDSLSVTGLSEADKKALSAFLQRLSTMREPALSDSVKVFIGQKYADETSRLYYSDELEAMLFNPASPQRNDSLYIVFLKETLASKDVPEEEKSRYRFQLENVSKNMPGERATDFTVSDKRGRRFKISDIEADYLILFFYNPDCVRCRRVEEQMKVDSVFQLPSLKIVAVYPGIMTREWLDAPSVLPSSWMDVCSPEGEVNNRLLYFIQSTPSIYLLDKHKNVILKDVSLRRLHDWLAMHIVKKCVIKSE